MQVYLYIDDMGIMCQGTVAYIRKDFYKYIQELDTLPASVDAAFPRSSLGKVRGYVGRGRAQRSMEGFSIDCVQLGSGVVAHARNLGIDCFSKHPEVQ